MRVFVAVQIPDEIKEKIVKLGKEIKQEGIVNVKPENMHLTLKFIGDVEKTDQIIERLGKVRFSKFDCRVHGVGAFPDEKYIRVVWAGIDGIDALAANVQEALGKKERFTGHATIARVKRKVDLKDFLEHHHNDEFGEFTVSSFELIQSELGPGGPRYTTIATFEAN